MSAVYSKVVFPEYRTRVDICIGKTAKEAVSQTRRLREVRDQYEEWEGFWGCCVHDEKGRIVIIITEEAQIDTIAHECYHATMRVLSSRGVSYSKESEEVYAHMIGYLTKKVSKLMDIYKEKNGK